MRPLEDLQYLLLDLISSHRPVEAARAANLDIEDWDALLTMVRQHRLGPLLHWRLTREKAAVDVPDGIRVVLAESFRKSALRALEIQRELLTVHGVLAQAGISCIALKGAYLAYNAYPHPALRPMRDLDVLVPAGRALDAYQALLDSGCRRMPEYPEDPLACLVADKHLPPLRTASGRLNLELHTRVSQEASTQTAGGDTHGLWARGITSMIAGKSIVYLSQTDLLLHLIVHAAYDHGLDNGPLVLSDMSYLVGAADIDWCLFWKMAEEGGWRRGCLLLLKMAQRYCGDMSVVYPEDFLHMPHGVEDMVERYSPLMLSDFDTRGEIRFGGDLSGKSIREKTSILVARAFPPRSEIIALYPGAAGSCAGICRGYLAKYANIVIRRMPKIWASLRNPAVRDSMRKTAELNRWLMRS